CVLRYRSDSLAISHGELGPGMGGHGGPSASERHRRIEGRANGHRQARVFPPATITARRCSRCGSATHGTTRILTASRECCREGGKLYTTRVEVLEIPVATHVCRGSSSQRESPRVERCSSSMVATPPTRRWCIGWGSLAPRTVGTAPCSRALASGARSR